MKKLGVSVFTVIFIFGFLAAVGAEESSCVGTWISVEHYVGGQRMKDLEGRSIVFNKDKTARTALGEGTYVVKDKAVLFTKKGASEPSLTYKIVDDTLVVDSGFAKIVYKRKS